jgi:hypothetical protein
MERTCDLQEFRRIAAHGCAHEAAAADLGVFLRAE